MGELKTLLDLLYRLIGLKVHRLFIWKVDGKLDYRRIFLMNWELKQPPDGLRWANIPSTAGVQRQGRTDSYTVMAAAQRYI